MGAIISSIADVEPPAYGRNLTYPGIYAEHGNPVLFHLSMETNPQGEAITVREQEAERSEGCLVMRQIGIETLSRSKELQTFSWF
jgi:hypothetical protein